MSHIIVKKVMCNEAENIILLTAASNNVHPQYFEESEYYEGNKYTFEQKLHSFFIGVLDGCIKIRSSAGRFYKLAEQCFEYYRIGSKDYDLIGIDFDYKVRLTTELKELIVKEYAIPAFYKKEFCEKDVFYKMKEFNKSIPSFIEKKEKEFADKGLIVIRSAKRSSIYKGFVVLLAKNNNIYLARGMNYTLGLLDNSHNNAICLGEKKILFTILGFDGIRGWCDTKEEFLAKYNRFSAEEFLEAENIIKEKLGHLKMSMLPYNDYPLIEKY